MKTNRDKALDIVNAEDPFGLIKLGAPGDEYKDIVLWIESRHLAPAAEFVKWAEEHYGVGMKAIQPGNAEAEVFSWYDRVRQTVALPFQHDWKVFGDGRYVQCACGARRQAPGAKDLREMFQSVDEHEWLLPDAPKRFILGLIQLVEQSEAGLEDLRCRLRALELDTKEKFQEVDRRIEQLVIARKGGVV